MKKIVLQIQVELLDYFWVVLCCHLWKYCTFVFKLCFKNVKGREMKLTQNITKEGITFFNVQHYKLISLIFDSSENKFLSSLHQVNRKIYIVRQPLYYK